jgi:hypothetical protein
MRRLATPAACALPACWRQPLAPCVSDFASIDRLGGLDRLACSESPRSAPLGGGVVSSNALHRTSAPKRFLQTTVRSSRESAGLRTWRSAARPHVRQMRSTGRPHWVSRRPHPMTGSARLVVIMVAAVAALLATSATAGTASASPTATSPAVAYVLKVYTADVRRFNTSVANANHDCSLASDPAQCTRLRAIRCPGSLRGSLATFRRFVSSSSRGDSVSRLE